MIITSGLFLKPIPVGCVWRYFSAPFVVCCCYMLCCQLLLYLFLTAVALCYLLLWGSESAGIDDTCTKVVCNNYDGTMVDPTSELLTNTLNVYSGDSLVASFSNVEVSASFGNGEGFQNARSVSDREERSTLEEDTLPNSVVDRVNVVEVPNQSSLDTKSQECSLSLLSICSTAQQRRLLRTHGIHGQCAVTMKSLLRVTITLKNLSCTLPGSLQGTKLSLLQRLASPFLMMMTMHLTNAHGFGFLLSFFVLL